MRQMLAGELACLFAALDPEMPVLVFNDYVNAYVPVGACEVMRFVPTEGQVGCFDAESVVLAEKQPIFGEMPEEVRLSITRSAVEAVFIGEAT